MDEYMNYVDSTVQRILTFPQRLRGEFTRFSGENRVKYPKNEFQQLTRDIQYERRKYSPMGSSKNPRIVKQDVEQAYFELNQRDYQFSKEIKRQLDKIHFKDLLSPRNSQARRHKIKIPDFTQMMSTKSHINDRNANSTITRHRKRISPQPPNIRQKRPLSTMALDFSPFRELEELNFGQQIVTPTVKSRPMHLDPNYQFSKIPTSPKPQKTRNINTANSLQGVIEDCTELRQTYHIPESSLKQYRTQNAKVKERILEEAQDMEECNMLADDVEQIENMMSTKKYNRQIIDSVLTSTLELKEENVNNSKLMNLVTGARVWRTRNGNFIRRIDRLINSIPTQKFQVNLLIIPHFLLPIHPGVFRISDDFSHSSRVFAITLRECTPSPQTSCNVFWTSFCRCNKFKFVKSSDTITILKCESIFL